MNIEATADLIMSARHSDAFDREACVKILRDNLSGESRDTKERGMARHRSNADAAIPSATSGNPAARQLVSLAQSSQPKHESWQEIAREAARRLWNGGPTEQLIQANADIILAAIERSHAAQAQSDDQLRLKLAREAVVDWRARKLSDCAAMFAVSFAIMPQPKPTEADIERAKAIMAAQPQPSKASTRGERSEQYDENALVAKLKPLIGDQPTSSAKATDDKQEWTPEYIAKLVGGYANINETARIILSDHINAAIAVVKSDTSEYYHQCYVQCAKDFSSLRKELAAEREKSRILSNMADGFREQIKKHQAEYDKQEQWTANGTILINPDKSVQYVLTTHAKPLAHAINAALADDDKKRFFAFWRENGQLKQELTSVNNELTRWRGLYQERDDQLAAERQAKDNYKREAMELARLLDTERQRRERTQPQLILVPRNNTSANMELEIINKLYLELSQVTTARNTREIVLVEALERCVSAIDDLEGHEIEYPRAIALSAARRSALDVLAKVGEGR